jgi:hypothetical protein
VAQQNTVKGDDSNQDDGDRYYERDRPNMAMLRCAYLVQETPVLPGGCR